MVLVLLIGIICLGSLLYLRHDVSSTDAAQSTKGQEKTSEETFSSDQLTDAILANDIELVNKIIASDSVDINCQDSKDYYPIEKVLPMENCNMAIILLDSGANPHIIPEATSTDGQTVYEYIMSPENDYSAYFKDIFKNHTK